MVEVRPGSARFFDRGIDRILGTPDAADALLRPDTGGLVPSALARPSAIDTLLDAANLQAFLHEALRPEPVDAELLMPACFQATLDATRAALSGLAVTRRYANPPLGRLLDQAVQVLDEEEQLRDLLGGYLRSLVQG